MRDARDHATEALRLADLLDGRGSRDQVLVDTADCLREPAVRVLLLAGELDFATATAELHFGAAMADGDGRRRRPSPSPGAGHGRGGRTPGSEEMRRGPCRAR